MPAQFVDHVSHWRGSKVIAGKITILRVRVLSMDAFAHIVGEKRVGVKRQTIRWELLTARSLQLRSLGVQPLLRSLEQVPVQASLHHSSHASVSLSVKLSTTVGLELLPRWRLV